ncbi:RNA-directed DNA polymerase [Sinorhizobium sp. M103]|uniref:RNA-directed DNA polymerase n=1 Tax=Sinorhizobium sp. M103 TaxID=2976821 RepID=UPI0023D87290|nr:RNA-directed DNA polymerase [Sinorhizobium sp. M103]WEJ09300.1 RNA-directed DNA polymerase [Sinorhizobium sp. M103]
MLRLLSEKSKGLCRQLVIPNVKDALVLQALSDALWVELKEKAPSQNAFYAPQDQAFSKPLKGLENEYGPVNAWLNFQEKIIGFSEACDYVIVTDIANYYDCISYDHLRNILADLSIAREHALDLLIYTLSHMLWQPDYMPRVQTGLPQMNLDAPRLLAHCFLFEIDGLLKNGLTVNFARYMDDIDIGVDSRASAKRALRDLDLALQTRQLRLNTGKTKILNREEAAKHFKIRENAFLDGLEERIKSKESGGSSCAHEAKFLNFGIGWGLRGQCFATGNGEKILKRSVNYLRRTGGLMEPVDFRSILLNWPNSRQVALNWWVNSASPDTYLSILTELVSDDHLVDDIGPIQICNALVTARLQDQATTDGHIKTIATGLPLKTPLGFNGAAWLLSKYGSADDLISLIEGNVSVWRTKETVSRTVGGLFPRFFGTNQLAKYENIILRSGSKPAQQVLSFHKELSSTQVGFSAVKPFIMAPNPSLPNRISHAKLLMVASALQNESVPVQARLQLWEKHAIAFEDPYYAKNTPMKPLEK